jgi:DNA-binding beta-propeller fold protein YncE
MRCPRSLRSAWTVLAGALSCLALQAAHPGLLRAQAVPHYRVTHRIPVGGPDGFWDYLTVDTAGNRLFISHGTRVQVLDLTSFGVAGELDGTPGVHGVALAEDLRRGFTSNGRDSTVTVFDLETLKPVASIQATGRNPDAILYDPGTKRVFTFNHSRGNVTAIDAVADSVVGTIPVGGTLEFGVTDGAGRLFVNVEDSSQLVEIDPAALEVRARWPLAPCEEPTGLAIDRAHDRLFVGCGNGLMAVVDAASGKVMTTLPVGRGVDATRYDPGTGLAFASAGEGSITVVREEDPDHYSVVQTVPTERGARTMGLDERSHRLYTVTMKFGPAPAPTADRPHPRPRPVPGSFVALVLEP